MYVKARPSRLLQHELEALKQKTKLSSLDWYVMERYYKLRAHCLGLELDEKPLVDKVHHEIGRCYQTLHQTCFTQETPFNMVYLWKMELYAMFDHPFSFVVHLPHSKFTFTHHVQCIIKEVDSDVEVVVDPNAMTIVMYDHQPSQAYVEMILRLSF